MPFSFQLYPQLFFYRVHQDYGSRLPYGRDSKRDLSNVFFDCTNYYSEIDIPSGDKQKGPLKENRHSPIIGQLYF